MFEFEEDWGDVLWFPCEVEVSEPSNDVSSDSSVDALGAPLDDSDVVACGPAAGLGLISIASSCSELATASAHP